MAKKKPNGLIKKFNKWDRGEFTYAEDLDKVVEANGGELVGKYFKKCTICPVMNGTCHSYIKIQIYGFNPNTKGKLEEVWLCPHGHKNIDECNLSK